MSRPLLLPRYPRRLIPGRGAQCPGRVRNLSYRIYVNGAKSPGLKCNITFGDGANNILSSVSSLLQKIHKLG